MMTISQELYLRQRELLEQLDELDEAIVEGSAWLERRVDSDAEDFTEQRERLAWLHRQQAGVRVMLGETERALLTLDE